MSKIKIYNLQDVCKFVEIALRAEYCVKVTPCYSNDHMLGDAGSWEVEYQTTKE